MIPMCSFASNVIGSHRAPPDATLFKKKSKNIFRTLFFRTRSQKGTFKAFPTKWYTFSLFQSSVVTRAAATGGTDAMAVTHRGERPLLQHAQRRLEVKARKRRRAVQPTCAPTHERRLELQR